MSEAGENRCPLGCGHDTEFFAPARDLEYFTSPETYRYDVCNDCDSVFLHVLLRLPNGRRIQAAGRQTKNNRDLKTSSHDSIALPEILLYKARVTRPPVDYTLAREPQLVSISQSRSRLIF